MEPKTTVIAEPDKQDLLITRKFDLPVALLFKAFTTPEIVEQWMGTRVMKLENKRHGSWQFETTDPQGNRHGFNGTIHEFVPNLRITRTFEMADTGFPVQLEFLEFLGRGDNSSELSMHIIFKSVDYRAQLLQLPFAQGINMAHNRLQAIASQFI